ncbi:MAG: hypothetical protein V4663_05980 [Bacteroidota bacterium]
MKKDLTKNQALVFSHNRTAKGFHFTSDGQAFAKEGDANNHKHTLEDKSVEYIENPNQLDEPEGDQGTGAAKPAKVQKAKGVTKKADAKEKQAKNPEQLELDAYRAQYETLYGKKANNFMKIEKLKALISEKDKPSDQSTEQTNP